jgi:hypothetical protein
MNTRGIIMLGVGAVAGYVIYNRFLKPKSDNSNFTGALRAFESNTHTCDNGETINLDLCDGNINVCCDNVQRLRKAGVKL